MIDSEIVARKMAAQKMGLIKDPDGSHLPDDLWRQMLPAAESYLEDLAFELHQAETSAIIHEENT